MCPQDSPLWRVPGRPPRPGLAWDRGRPPAARPRDHRTDERGSPSCLSPRSYRRADEGSHFSLTPLLSSLFDLSPTKMAFFQFGEKEAGRALALLAIPSQGGFRLRQGFGMQLDPLTAHCEIGRASCRERV